MAMPAFMFELETPLEERVARLEANVEHIQKDVSDIKIDVRRLGDKIDSVDQKLSARIDSVKDSVTALAINMEKSFANFHRIGVVSGFDPQRCGFRTSTTQPSA
ncbi:MAG: hypothetical protein JWO52_2529 [Gammaproteobacteria bacterium]|jgi:DNA anti-recombination protein RmuC|nr:hypothetical protein [Gammaproteobacteria bacterium]